MSNQKDNQNVLRYAAFDIPSLEDKIRKLTSEIIDLGFKKKDLNNTIMLQRGTQLSDLGQVIIRYQECYRIQTATTVIVRFRTDLTDIQFI